MSKTILEVANMLGVTKNAIKYRARQLPPDMTEKGSDGVIYITDKGIETIQQLMGKEEPPQPRKETTYNQEEPPTTGKEPRKEPAKGGQTTTQRTTYNQEEEPLYKALLETVETLREQLKIKDTQIQTLSETVQSMAQNINQEQYLHAGTMQKTLTAGEPESTAEPAKKKRGWKWWQK